jgi:exopolysaccharide biosynthesis polyprenyl glycosylphosphotransferase
VVLTADKALDESQVAQLMQARLLGMRVYDIVGFYEKFWRKIPISELRDDWFLYSSGFRLMHHALALNVKRLMDILLSLTILVGGAPLMLLTVILIKLDSKGSIFYTQLRTGQRGKSIRIYKFRTMVEDAEKQGAAWAEVNDARVTRVGRWLRAWHLDELPQAWNVLKGDMSCIGPRPERPEFTQELEKHIPYYDLRYLVKPGITGWAQVMHPYGSSIEDARKKLEYDLYYIKHYSLLLDAFIALKTLRVMFFGGGR